MYCKISHLLILEERHVQLCFTQPHHAGCLSSTYRLFRYKISISLDLLRHLETSCRYNFNCVNTAATHYVHNPLTNTRYELLTLAPVELFLLPNVTPQELLGDRPRDVTSVEFRGSFSGHGDAPRSGHSLPHTVPPSVVH
jgi:hypothetical protein